MKNRVSRRKFLAVSTTTAAAAVAGAAVVGGVAGFFEGQSFAPTREITYTNTITQTRTVTAQPEKLKAGYIYVGPIGDYGWSYAHDVGRKKADAKTPNVESVYIESVPEAEAAGAIDTLIAQGAKLIAATSFGYMDALAEAAEKHPDLYFLHTGSGFRSGAAGNAPQNMSVIYAEEYQVYYLNGMAAGAVTNTGKLCFVAPFPIPVVWRNLNAFALGANYAYKKRTGRDIEVYAIWIYTWYDPGKT
ncbi:MAG: BMP family ABC transporter substrate-binding protein, partial [Nitrososphaerota archaeon]